MTVARRHGFSPCVKPFCPSPALTGVSQSVDGLSTSDAGSCSSTPKMLAAQSSPCQSTPGCNPMAKPFLPASQREAFELPTRAEEKKKIAITKMLQLQAAAAEPITFADDVPEEILADPTEECWLVRVLQNMPQVTPLPETPKEAEIEVASPPPAPMTSLAFLRSRKPCKKTKPQFSQLTPPVCA